MLEALAPSVVEPPQERERETDAGCVPLRRIDDP
jgi:hypothetical protein